MCKLKVKGCLYSIQKLKERRHPGYYTVKNSIFQTLTAKNKR